VGIIGKFGNQMMLSTSSKEEREPRCQGIGLWSSPSFGPPWFGGPGSVTSPRAKRIADVTPPGDAEPRSSVDDDNAEKWAANR
jgi:hypothetical protein